MSAGPHAVHWSSRDNDGYCYDANGNQVRVANSAHAREIEYSRFDKALRVTTPDGAETRWEYGPGRERVLRIDTENGAERRTYFVGSTELVITATGNRIWRRQIAGVAIAKIYPRTRVHQVAYLHRDHLGSVEAMSDEAGDTAGLRLSYGPYGKRRAADPWNFPAPGTFFQWTLEGFTGHEQIGAGGVVHMGGRLYDPRLGRFLQADPFVQFPESSQGLNRYTYVLNNPLRYTDSSGYGIDGDYIRLIAAIAITVYTGNAAAGAETFMSGLGWAAGGGFVSGYVATGSTDGAVKGAFAASAFYGVGQYFQSFDNVKKGKSVWSQLSTNQRWGYVAAHGATGGVVAELQGGKFGHGFVSAGLTKAATPAISSIDNAVGETIAAAIVGGSVSEATGGKFANGAATAAFAYAFNQLASQGDNKQEFDLEGVDADEELVREAYRTLKEANAVSFSRKTNHEKGWVGTVNGPVPARAPSAGKVDWAVYTDGSGNSYVKIGGEFVRATYLNHTHGNDHRNFRFSEDDVISSNKTSLPIFLGDPNYNFRIYEPGSGAGPTGGEVLCRGCLR